MDDAALISSLLPTRTVRTLARAGIDTIEQIKANYPKKLLRIEGFGMRSLRAVEAAFVPDQKYDPEPRTYKRDRRVSKRREELSQHLHKTTPKVLV